MKPAPLSLVDAGWRQSYPVHPDWRRQGRLVMEGKLNVGGGPYTIAVDTPQPWLFQDPRVGPQTIVVLVAGNDEAARVLASGWWIVPTDDGIELHTIDRQLQKQMVISLVVIG